MTASRREPTNWEWKGWPSPRLDAVFANCGAHEARAWRDVEGSFPWHRLNAAMAEDAAWRRSALWAILWMVGADEPDDFPEEEPDER